MSNVPLPIRSCIVTYMGDGRGLHYTLGVAAGTALIEQPPGSQLDLYTADQMRSYAAAVSAAKDAEIAALRADFTALQRAIVGDTGASAILEAGRLRERVRVLEDALRGLMVGCKYCNIQGQWHWHEKAIASNEALDAARAALAARKGEA